MDYEISFAFHDLPLSYRIHWWREVMLWLKELSHTHCMSMRCQYRYICHEVQRTRQVYLYFRNMILKNYEKVKQHQCQQLLTKDEIAIQLHTYLQKYAPMITWLEEQSMVKDLWQFQTCIYYCWKDPIYVLSLWKYHEYFILASSKFACAHLWCSLLAIRTYSFPLGNHWQLFVVS